MGNPVLCIVFNCKFEYLWNSDYLLFLNVHKPIVEAKFHNPCGRKKRLFIMDSEYFGLFRMDSEYFGLFRMDSGYFGLLRIDSEYFGLFRMDSEYFWKIMVIYCF